MCLARYDCSSTPEHQYNISNTYIRCQNSKKLIHSQIQATATHLAQMLPRSHVAAAVAVDLRPKSPPPAAAGMGEVSATDALQGEKLSGSARPQQEREERPDSVDSSDDTAQEERAPRVEREPRAPREREPRADVSHAERDPAEREPRKERAPRSRVKSASPILNQVRTPSPQSRALKAN